MSQGIKELKLAVLIDADNVPYSNVKGMMEEIAKFGTPTTKRIYADWTKPNASGWKSVLLEHAITPIQQYSYTVGKNSSDSAMIIDAMDLLYTGKLDGFCLVSSDSDFTRLASRLREAGLIVYGFGEDKTPKPFVGACDKFIYTEILLEDENTEPQKKKSVSELKGDTRLVNLLRNAVEDSADEDGWAYLGTVGQNIANQAPEFDPRNYGYRKLSELLRATQLFNLEKRMLNNDNAAIYVRDIRRK